MRRHCFSLSGFLFLLLAAFPSGPLQAAPCFPDRLSSDVSVSIGKVHRFFQKSRGAPSFNFDRLDYLLGNFEKSAREWAACHSGSQSAHATILIGKVHQFRDRIRRERSLTPLSGGALLSDETVRSLENLLSGFPEEVGGKKSPVNSGSQSAHPPSLGLPSPPAPPVRQHLLRTWAILGGVVAGGLFFLLLIVRRSSRSVPDSGISLQSDDILFLKNAGTRWNASHRVRREVLEEIRERLGKGGRTVRLRAQLLARSKGKKWIVVDELSDDEGGLARTFDETPEILQTRERIEEIPLGDGEVRTHLLLPLAEESGEALLLAVDAITSPEIVHEIPDPSGLLGYHRLKERLVSAAIEEEGKGGKGRIGLISFFFEDPEMARILERTDEESSGIKSFIVREAIGLTWPGTVVFGESPGFFHLVLHGRSETETGLWIRKLSEGLGPELPERKKQGEISWFRGVLVAYTSWKDPDPKKLDPFLARVSENLRKLVKNPSIRTVIDT
jgi:hypothetical protein